MIMLLIIVDDDMEITNQLEIEKQMLNMCQCIRINENHNQTYILHVANSDERKL